MREHALEDVMLDFSQQKFDVLLCTTIIESGLDIPDGEHADYLRRGSLRAGSALSDAQARRPLEPAGLRLFHGSVGQGALETAQKRLDAIREFTEFGSGFRIAMRDLETARRGRPARPAAEQPPRQHRLRSYCSCWRKRFGGAGRSAQAELRDVETRMDVHVNAYLPAEYVTGDRQRLEVYKRIASITTAAQRRVEEELVDRFGDEPLRGEPRRGGPTSRRCAKSWASTG